MTYIMLRTAPNRMGNSKRVLIALDNNRIVGVTDASYGRGGGHPALEVKVAPKEINDLVAQAKRAGIYK